MGQELIDKLSHYHSLWEQGKENEAHQYLDNHSELKQYVNQRGEELAHEWLGKLGEAEKKDGRLDRVIESAMKKIREEE